MNRNPLSLVLAIPFQAVLAAPGPSAPMTTGVLTPDAVLAPGSGAGANAPFAALTGGTLFAGNEHGLGVVRGGLGTVYFEPLVFATAGALASDLDPVTGVATLQPSASGVAAVTYGTNASGLYRLDADATLAELDDEFFLYGGAMAGATDLQAVGVYGPPASRHVFGIGTDGKTVASGKQALGGWTAGPTNTFAEDVLAYTCIDFDGDGALEIAVLFHSWLKVFELDWTPIVALRSEDTDVGALARVQGSGGDRLAWATLDASGDPYLRVLTMAGTPLQETPLYLDDVFPAGTCAGTELIPGAMAAGDMDGDGEDDLVLLDAQSGRALALRNQGGAPRFTAATLGTDHQVLDPDDGSTCAAGAAGDRVIVADLDGDPFAEAVVARQGTGEVYIYRHATHELVPGPSSSGWVSSQTCGWMITHQSQDHLRVNLAFDFDGVVQAQNLPTHAQVSAWYLPDSSNPTAPQQVHANVLWEIQTESGPSEDWLPYQYGKLELTDDGAPHGSCWTADQPHYFIRLRWGTLEPNPQSTDTFVPTLTTQLVAVTLRTCSDLDPDLDGDSFEYMDELIEEGNASASDWHLLWEVEEPGFLPPESLVNTKLGAILIDVDRPTFNAPAPRAPLPDIVPPLPMYPWNPPAQ